MARKHLYRLISAVLVPGLIGCAQPGKLPSAKPQGSAKSSPSSQESSGPDKIRLTRHRSKSSPASQKDQSVLQAAYQWEQEGELDKAEQLYRHQLMTKQGSAAAILGLARLAHRQGQNDRARQLYDQAIQQHPDSPAVWNDWGQFLLSQQQTSAAVEAFHRAVEMQPSAPRYHNNLAIALVCSGQFDEALKHFRVTAGDAGAHYNAGVVLWELGQAEQSAEQFKRALEIDPSFKTAEEALHAVTVTGARPEPDSIMPNESEKPTAPLPQPPAEVAKPVSQSSPGIEPRADSAFPVGRAALMLSNVGLHDPQGTEDTAIKVEAAGSNVASESAWPPAEGLTQ